MNALNCQTNLASPHTSSSLNSRVGGNCANPQVPGQGESIGLRKFASTLRIGSENSPKAYLALAQRQMVKGAYESAAKLLRIAYNLALRNIAHNSVSILQLLDLMMICTTKLPDDNPEIDLSLEILSRHIYTVPSRMRIVRELCKMEDVDISYGNALAQKKPDCNWDSKMHSRNIFEKRQEYFRLTRLYLSMAQSLEEKGRIDEALFCALKGCKFARMASRY